MPERPVCVHFCVQAEGPAGLSPEPAGPTAFLCVSNPSMLHMSECAESMQCLSYSCLARVGVPEQLGAVFEGQQLAGLVRCAGGHHLPILGSQKATG